MRWKWNCVSSHLLLLLCKLNFALFIIFLCLSHLIFILISTFIFHFTPQTINHNLSFSSNFLKEKELCVDSRHTM